MADAYVATGNQNAITTDITALTVLQSGSATARGFIDYFSAGVAGDTTMADHMQGIVAQRATTAGTGTAVVPAPLDTAAAVSGLTGTAENHTAEPTYTSATELWDGSIHLRSLLQVHLRRPWVVPSTANAGIGFFLQSNASATQLWHFTAEWEE